MESILYVGMDVHKETYSVCAYDAKNDRYLYEHKMKASSKNVDAKQLAKSLFVKDYSPVHVSDRTEESIKEFCRMKHICRRLLTNIWFRLIAWRRGCAR